MPINSVCLHISLCRLFFCSSDISSDRKVVIISQASGRRYLAEQLCKVASFQTLV